MILGSLCHEKKYKIFLDGPDSESDFLFGLCRPWIKSEEDEWTDVRPQSLGILPLSPSQNRGQLIDF